MIAEKITSKNYLSSIDLDNLNFSPEIKLHFFNTEAFWKQLKKIRFLVLGCNIEIMTELKKTPLESFKSGYPAFDKCRLI